MASAIFSNQTYHPLKNGFERISANSNLGSYKCLRGVVGKAHDGARDRDGSNPAVFSAAKGWRSEGTGLALVATIFYYYYSTQSGG